MTALTKSEMAERLYEELGLNKREAKEIVELFFEEIRACLEANEQVKLSGFGNFDLRDKSQRPGRNPKTGEEIPISARRVVTFRPGQKLKARVESFDGTGFEDDDSVSSYVDEPEVSTDQATDENSAEAPLQFGMRPFDGGRE